MNDPLAELSGGDIPTLDLIFMITLVALLPSTAVMMAFSTRTIIIFSFTRNAMGVQQTPPNMVLAGVAPLLTLCIMNPVIGRISGEAYQPYVREEIAQQETAGRMGEPLEELVFHSIEKSTLDHFVQMSGTDVRENVGDYPLTVVTPAFVTSEPKRSFMSDFLIYLSFFLTDMVVATALVSMGMVMLPPTMIVLPFKLLLFVTVDGWELLSPGIIQSPR